jgi:CRP/FNR family transcriptional regulator, cyclic AMP receptor protein
VADVLIDTESGQIRVAQMKKNDFMGEIAVLCDVPRTATIKASEPLSTLKITKDMFYRLVAEFPQMAVEVMRELAHRLEDTNEKLRDATQKLREATKAA